MAGISLFWMFAFIPVVVLVYAALSALEYIAVRIHARIMKNRSRY